MNGTTASVPSASTFESELHPRIVFASMAGVVAAMLMAALDGTIVGTAMPRIIADLHGFEHYTAVTTIYMLDGDGRRPASSGKLSDLYGRKPFLLAGVCIFVRRQRAVRSGAEHDPAGAVSRRPGPRRGVSRRAWRSRRLPISFRRRDAAASRA